uniref:Uncharacterized protein n=2 Tax=Panagrolaimus sp. PS1159 TaxID=55785 RepID=A0AC35FVH6_9BILA
MKDSGKSGIIEALRQSLNWSKRDKIIVEIGYDETMSRDYVISMIDRSNPKLCILIISNTIGRLDAEVARYVINSKKRLCVSLNKSDEIIYNLEKQHSFYGNQDYTRKRLEAANNEFKKVNIFNLPCFTTSALVLAGILNNTKYFVK